ncbi:hypothetical protein CR155_11175 [Pollutimonas nitritireducens]|uniref:Zn-ribbon domain-containing OB-fold protein n=2 Tax=Pollutimonas nitritireducens TaxID=2045209 RepID=A0A2N4UG50_9BURK|nr:hypothetical protein CR155_11175 [Pollutimonas nitritireducens]
MAISNADSAPYWDGAKRRQLLIRRCKDCNTLHFMPRYICPTCWSDSLEWVEASGAGSVYSYTIIRRAPLPAFVSLVPYVVALIELEEGVRMLTNIVGDNALSVRIGDEVRVTFEERGDETVVPQFQLAVR